MKTARLCFPLGFFAIILSILPFIVSILTPVTPGRVNLLWDNWLYDFNYYRSIITQGKSGQIMTIDKYTTEEHGGKFIRTSYIVLGQLSRIINLDETYVYHLARIFWGAVFIFVTYLLIKSGLRHFEKIIPLTFLFCLFAAGYPDVNCTPSCHLIPRLWSMTQLDPIRRLTFLPHYLLGQIAFIVLLLSFLYSGRKMWLFIILSSMFIGLVSLDHPPALLLIYPVLILSLLFLGWKKNLNKTIVLKFELISLITLPFLIYILTVTNSFPWSLTRQAHFTMDIGFVDLALTLGPVFIIGLITAFFILFNSKKYPLGLIVSASWLIFVFVTVFFVKHFDYFATIRFLQVAPHVPSAILTSYALYVIYKKIRHSLSQKKWLIIYLTICSIVFLPTLSTLYMLYYDQFDYAIYFAKNSLPNIPYPPYVDYPPIDWMNGFSWLKKNSNQKEIVLSDFTAGNFIPTYAGNTVYYGHIIETANINQKEKLVKEFFKSESPKKQSEFLKKNKINYIFFGPQEKAYLNKDLDIPDTQIVYKNSLVIIYKVILDSDQRS